MIGSPAEREHWFPVAFANDLDGTTMIPFDLFNVPWVAFRDADGAAGCVRMSCAHRAYPISLGKLVTAGSSARTTAGSTPRAGSA